MTPIRLGFVLHAMQVAGAEVLVAETIRRLGSRIDPTIICLDHVGQLGERLRGEGIEVLALDRRPGRDWRLIPRLRSALVRRRVEVLHAHQYSPFFYAALANRLRGSRPRIIFTEHGRHYPDIVSAKRRLFNRLILSHLADDINACCQFSADALARLDGFPRRRIRVIENGIDVTRYAEPADRVALRRKLGLDPLRRYLITVARFHPVKDHAMLLDAFAQLAPSRPDVDLLLAGDGPLRPQLVEQAQRLGIADRVQFLGVRADVPDLLRAADLFALTSVSEAASLTLMEAMAAGRAVVVTAVGGNPEIVRPDIEGLLVPRGDSAAAAAALGRLLDDPACAQRMGEAGRRRVQDRYRLEATIDAYAQLYERFAPR